MSGAWTRVDAVRARVYVPSARLPPRDFPIAGTARRCRRRTAVRRVLALRRAAAASSEIASCSRVARAEQAPRAIAVSLATVPTRRRDQPGVFYFLGVASAKKGWNGMPHSPDYVADESALRVGARAMVAVLLDRLGAR
jgi:metal-dependent amidase/aminoacylase/carboxypeptidase family protein